MEKYQHNIDVWRLRIHKILLLKFCKFGNFRENFIFANSVITLVNVYVDLVVFMRIAGTS